MPDSKPAKCALCGVKSITVREEMWQYYFCFDCVNIWSCSPECINLIAQPGWTPEVRLVAIQAFVRRVRWETCQSVMPNGCQTYLTVSHYDCWGCTAYAPRDIHVRKDCPTCALNYNERCNAKAMCPPDLNQYVPRSCGNCFKKEECNMANPERVCCVNWQPRPVEYEICCGNCARSGKSGCNGKWNNAGNCTTFQPRPAEPPRDITEKLCGDCAKQHKGECAESGFCDKNHSRFQEKSCSSCGHFHAEPMTYWDGYCDASPDFKSQYYKKGQFALNLANSNPCGKFTPRAAPQTERVYNCEKCDHLQISESHPNGLCDTHPCEYKTKSTPPAACARCGTTENLKETTRSDSYYLHSHEVNFCVSCHSDWPDPLTSDEWCSKETAAGRPWFVDMQNKSKVCARCGHVADMIKGLVDIYYPPSLNPNEKKLVVCSNCGKAFSSGSFSDYAEMKSKETAAGKVWHCDQNLPNCAHCGTTDKVERYMEEAIVQIRELVKESETKMYHCEKCGNEFALLEGVKYCPYCRAECGGGVEKNVVNATDVLDAQLREADKRLATNSVTIKSLREDKERLQRENVALAQQVREAKMLIEAQQAGMTAMEKESDLLAEDVARVHSLNEDLEEKIQHLRRRGIPWKCRKCPLKPEEGQCKFLEQWWGWRGVFGATFCDSSERADQIYKEKHPAKPAALWKLRRQVKQKETKERKQKERQELELKIKELEAQLHAL